ncbi:DUF4330 domain-containing protein [Lyngbya confervoides]|uniref:DUF4330 domain-containing protein n=1 Tax=Lyngbya confervoides BDU141951 TaxID=1574623 RepID=A0ABD4SZD3_9CYAN|nr:DUF4330 domain-containing protein [Lyngbya confervoides]MCM1981664.1 DUF4330 domain-containing protein [Lyngbya confervoides BDU141951]
MAIVDAKGRLFGKLSLIDIGAGLVILMVLVGILVVPGESGQSIAQSGASVKPVEVDVLVLGLSARDPDKLFQAGDKASFIIRNQPYGEVTIDSIQTLPKTIVLGLPDGTPAVVDEPREESQFSRNFLFTLEGKGRLTDKGPLLGNVPIKVGTPVELEGPLYTFRASVIDVRVGE